MPQPYGHPFYRIWFTIIDPVVLLGTVVACIYSPAMILESVIPPSIEAYNPISHGPLLWQSAALYGFMGVIFAVLLRASSDPAVWRIVQAATLAVDLSLIGVFYAVLVQQDRLNVGLMKSGDWFNFGFTALVAVIRTAYLLGVGGGSGKKRNLKKRQ